MNDLGKIFQFRKEVRFFDFEESSFIIDISDSSLYNLGKSSALIAANIDGTNNLNKIAEVIRSSYNVTEEESGEVVLKLLSMLQQKNLVREVLEFP